MESLIKIGAEISKDSAKNLGDLIDRIFASAAKHRMEQGTVSQALSVVSTSLSVENTTITGCNITGEKHIS